MSALAWLVLTLVVCWVVLAAVCMAVGWAASEGDRMYVAPDEDEKDPARWLP